MLPHRYLNASDDPAAYAADACGRQAATAAWIASVWPADAAVWRFDAEAHDMGLDPWRQIVVMSGAQAGDYRLESADGRADAPVSGDHRLFVQLRDRPAGLTPPAGPPAGLRLERILLRVDEPLLVEASDADGWRWLAVAADDGPAGLEWIAVRLNADDLADVLAGTADLRSAFVDRRRGDVLRGRAQGWTGEVLFLPGDPPTEEELPEAGACLPA